MSKNTSRTIAPNTQNASDSTQSLIESFVLRPPFSYTPYGFLASAGSLHSGFMGEIYSAGLEGYILGNGYRIYSPTIMRFRSPDSMSPFHAGGYNAYAAFTNDPVNNVDPTGHYTMTVIRAVARFKMGLKKRAANKTASILTDAHPDDRSKALLRYKKMADVSDSNFRLITSHRDIKFLTGEERKFILTNRGDFVVGNQNIESFPHPMLKYFAGRDASVISAGYVALREKVVVFSNTTGHYHSSMAGKDPNTPVIEFFKNMGIIARRVRGDGNAEIPLSYNPWMDFNF